MYTSDSSRLIRQDIRANIALVLAHSHIPPHHRKRLTSEKVIRAIAELLTKEREFKDNPSRVNFYLLDLKEIGGKKFPFGFCIPEEMDFINKKGRKNDLMECFVGCRFGSIRDDPKKVLEPLLRYYGYETEFGDTGFTAGQVFDNIVNELRQVDFAIFDNRGTESKPNVYIEVGAAHANGNPYLLLEYKRSRLPSNLYGFQILRYSSYRELARKLSLALPSFFEKHDIEPPATRIL